MPQNAAVGAVYNPKGIPLTLAAASINDWVLVQQNATGRVGKMKLSVLIAPSLLAAVAEKAASAPEPDNTATAEDGGVTLDGTEGVITSEELEDAKEYILTLHNEDIHEGSVVTFQAVESNLDESPEVTDVTVSEGQAVATIKMPSFTGTLALSFTVSN